MESLNNIGAHKGGELSGTIDELQTAMAKTWRFKWEVFVAIGSPDLDVIRFQKKDTIWKICKKCMKSLFDKYMLF